MRFQHAHDKQARIHPPEARLFSEPTPATPGAYVLHIEDGPAGGQYLAKFTEGGAWLFLPQIEAAQRLTLPQVSELVRQCPVRAYMISLEDAS